MPRMNNTRESLQQNPGGYYLLAQNSPPIIFSMERDNLDHCAVSKDNVD